MTRLKLVVKADLNKVGQQRTSVGDAADEHRLGACGCVAEIDVTARGEWALTGRHAATALWIIGAAGDRLARKSPNTQDSSTTPRPRPYSSAPTPVRLPLPRRSFTFDMGLFLLSARSRR